MTVALVAFALVAIQSVALIALSYAYRRALDDRTIAAEDRILAVAARDAAEAKAAQLESERDGALGLAQALQDDAARARQEATDAIAAAARSADPGALAALVDGVLTRGPVPDAAAPAGGDGAPGPAAVPPAASAAGKGARPSAGRRAIRR